MDKHLLIVEDDELVQSLLAAYMQNESFKVSLAGNGKEMLACIDSEAIDLILLDLGLPDEDGLVLVRQVRARSSLPIIVLTARKEQKDRLAALEIGADDYLTKPFDPEELILRVRNMLGRADTGTADEALRERTEVFRFEGWTLDAGGHSLTDGKGKKVPLTRAEFNLLAALARAPNRVLSRDYLLDAVSRDADAPADRLIDVLVSRIRKKIEKYPKKPEIIITVVGCGYKFSAQLE
ncbi:MAG: two-component system response regulator [Rhodospirillaceae bacterium]|jgi:two-component system torCAD operon response regulator TorR|nr:two-component system response regulator [Rhodospirillaceae bacterium]|tara:strand:+ start:4609 stop:5319 length:711 start_codon:yes stop_codon:yes gene_type:complete